MGFPEPIRDRFALPGAPYGHVVVPVCPRRCGRPAARPTLALDVLQQETLAEFWGIAGETIDFARTVCY
jgi:hypothetical protein